MVGQTLGHYKILDKLGAGGMGEVYRAKDTTLDREVALKVLPSDLAQDQERLDRFQREAKTLAALDHPNIVTVFTVEQDESVHFLTMQLVEGQRLTELIAPDGMPLDGILEVAIPLSAALADAHEHGVIHRDLKPSNIMISNQGRVKILDFGLAKLKQAPEPEMASQLPTEPLTEEGRLLGTAPYMSPEQIEGKALDSRSDIFSLGIILYEMASGRRPFEGESSTSVMARILETEPEQLGERRPDLPPEFLRIVRRCLRKKPEDRYNDTRDLLVALRDLRQDSSSQVSRQEFADSRRQPRLLRTRWATAAALVVATTLLAGMGWSWFRSQEPRPTPGSAVARHSQVTFRGDARAPEISPDGAFLAYATEEGVVVHDLEGDSSVPVLESGPIEPVILRWSPDGSRLLVVGGIGGETKALVIPRLGGREQNLKMLGMMCWSPDGRQVAGSRAPGKSISIMDIESGVVAGSIDLEGSYRWKFGIDWSFLTDLLLAVTIEDDDRYSVWTLTASGSRQARVFQTDATIHSARWSLSEPAIYVLLSSSGDTELWKIVVDANTGEAVDSGQLILTGLAADLTVSISREGTKLAYIRTASSSTLWRLDLGQPPEASRVTSARLSSGTLYSNGFSISPDGEWVAISKGDWDDSDIHLISLRDSSMRQLTQLDGSSGSPVWSPDGHEVAFGSTHGGIPRIWRVNSQGGTPLALNTSDVSSTELALEWAPGQKLLYQQPGNDRWGVYDLQTGEDAPLLSDDLTESGWYFDPIYSPDGAQVVMGANLGGDDVITVRVAGPPGPARLLSTTGAKRGGILQSLPAAGHQGRSIKLAAKARTMGDGAQARLYLKLVLQNGETGFLEAMRDRPITSTEWGDYEIAGVIDMNASEIIIGGWLYGKGAAYFDEFDLSVRVNESDWESIPITNPGFDDPSLSEAPTGWQASSPTVTNFATISDQSSTWGNALRIESLESAAHGSYWPVGWSQDGEFVLLTTFKLTQFGYFYDPIIYRIPVNGGSVEPYLDTGLPDKIWWLDFSADGKFLIAETGKHQSDVWITQGFDPDLN